MRKILPLVFLANLFFSYCHAQQDDSVDTTYANELINPLEDDREREQIRVVREHLLGIEPEWRPHVVKNHVMGNPQEVEYIGEDENDQPIVSKRVLYYESGGKKEEVDYGMQGEEKGLIHGLSVKWFPSGIEQEVSYYEKGELHGPRLTFYPDGVMQSKEIFAKGLHVGIREEYYPDSTKRGEAHYIKGELQGDVWEYYPNGKRKSLATYKDGKEEGYAYKWHENGVIALKTFYKNGVVTNDGKNPAHIEYDEYHALKEKVEVVDGKLDGLAIFYYPSGQEKVRGTNKNDKRDGLFTTYYENGGICGEERYKDGVAVGKHWMKHENGKDHWIANYDDEGSSITPVKVFSPQGVLIKQFSIRKGVPHGKHQDWYPTGTLKFEGTHQMGKLDGEVLQYFENGMPWVFSHYQEGKLDGKIQKWHENGKVAFKGEYIHGKMNGELTEWFENGEIARKEYYKKGVPHGRFESYNDKGILLQESTYDHGDLVGSAFEYDERGNMTFQATYRKGDFHGNVTTYYSHEKPNCIYEYKDGMKHGEGLEYWENGNLKFQAQYQEDQLEGIAQAWYENGAIHFMRFYREGIPVGEQKFYYPCENPEDEDQFISKHLNYDSSGRLHNEQKMYFPGGKASSLVTYENGELNGLKSIWSENGDLLQECWYEHGKLEGKFFLKDPSGQEIVCYYEKNKKHGPFERFYAENPRYGKVKALEANYIRGVLEGEVTEYNQSGLKVSTCNFSNGMRDGAAYTFDTRGLLVSKVHFVKDKREGDSIEYFPNGRVFKVTPFVNNEIHGEQVSYFVDGTKASSIMYNKGIKNGISKSWNEKGNLIFEGEFVSGKKHGKFNKYYDDRTPRLLQEYRDDKLFSKKSYDPEGQLLTD